ncbi:D-arabinono-1,4-lactone oxidase [Deinococcus peraridilitoris]|uniref:FAD/FMN-dependent dehydrogenase n=1 Tax=Deinococcus peraridilitoris (strain DSM 19664 / LMG 22246 / CIP 109416 / KR-200) TaxID=937777 RepID=L0A8P9_DEIPD|nr:D-arabinono-1,4-lactone oxidase [Deinococcus peraridilitoris]AFZ69450.1 FAD/FMN-dependent dehydrogenase [Deinococcus peraridilitoris DSM 19664]
MKHSRNWAGNYTYQAARWHAPETTAELQEIIRRSSHLRVLATRHSFNDLADTPSDLLTLEHFDRIVELDTAQRTVTVEAGVRYGELCSFLHHHGFALHNLASLPHISVVGACTTATHGSGDRHGNLATAVTAIEFINAEGAVMVASRTSHREHFAGMVVALGALGVITRLTLEVLPAYAVQQDVYENLRLAQLAEHFDAITGGADSVSLFTDWQHQRFHQVWLKRRLAGDVIFTTPAVWFGATAATKELHPIPAMSAVNCTPQLGVSGPWHERLPHFRLEHTPSVGSELQSEYFVPRSRAVEALQAVFTLREVLAPVLLVSEIRTVAADDLWMSPCYQQDSIGIHFTWQPDWTRVREVLLLVEAQLAPFNARPHWGKLFRMPPERLHTLYEKRQDFQRLLRSYDPQGKFSNPFVNAYIFNS